MQNSALKPRPVLAVPTLRETTLFLLSSPVKAPPLAENYDEEDDFIFTKYHSPTSD